MEPPVTSGLHVGGGGGRGRGGGAQHSTDSTQDPPAPSTSGTPVSRKEAGQRPWSPADTPPRRRAGATCDSLCKSRVFREVPHPSRDLAVYTIIMTGPGPCGSRAAARLSWLVTRPTSPRASSWPLTALTVHARPGLPLVVSLFQLWRNQWPRPP